MTEPYGVLKYKLMLFGDDMMATVVHEDAPYRKSGGMTMKRYLIVPSPGLLMAYPELQKPNSCPIKTPLGMGIWVEYPAVYVDDHNPSRSYAVCRIECGFDGRPTHQSKKNESLKDENKSLEEENQSLRIQNISLREELMHMSGDILEYLKKINELNDTIKGGKGNYEAESELPPPDMMP